MDWKSFELATETFIRLIFLIVNIVKVSWVYGELKKVAGNFETKRFPKGVQQAIAELLKMLETEVKNPNDDLYMVYIELKDRLNIYLRDIHREMIEAQIDFVDKVVSPFRRDLESFEKNVFNDIIEKIKKELEGL